MPETHAPLWAWRSVRRDAAASKSAHHALLPPEVLHPALARKPELRERATAGLTAREVVTFLGCSRRKAETAFRQATGRSILEEIQNTRLEFVRNRLARGSLSIQSLTDFCGYRTPQALRKAFKRHTGMSMAEWRKRQTPLFADPD